MSRELAIVEQGSFEDPQDVGNHEDTEPTMALEVQEEDLHLEPFHEAYASIRAESPTDLIKLRQNVNGSFTMLASLEHCMLPYWAILGSHFSEEGVPEVGVDTMTIPNNDGGTPGDNGIKPYKILAVQVRRDDDIVGNAIWTYKNMQVIGVELNITTEETATFELELDGTHEVQPGTAPSPPLTYPVFTPITAVNTCFSIGARTLPVEEVRIAVRRPIEPPYTLCGGSYQFAARQGDVLLVEGEVTVLFDSLAEYNNFKADTPQNWALTTTGGDIGATSTQESFVLAGNKMKMRLATPEISGREMIRQPIEFQGYYDSVTDPGITAKRVHDPATVLLPPAANP